MIRAAPRPKTRLEISSLPEQNYADRLKVELAARSMVQFLRRPFVPLRVARQKVADGSASFDDRMTMILHNAQLQQWDEMWKHVDAAEKLAVDKPGVRWMRTILLATIGRNEEALKRLTDEAGRLIPGCLVQDEVFLAEFILNHVGSLVATPEFYELHRLLKPVYERPVAQRLPIASQTSGWTRTRRGTGERSNPASQIRQMWDDREFSILQGSERIEQALALQRKLAEAFPWDTNRQQKLYVSTVGRPPVSLLPHMPGCGHRSPVPSEIRPKMNRFAMHGCLLDRQQAQWADLLKWTTEWIARNPESASVYSQHLAALIDNDQLDAAYGPWRING